VQAAHVQLAEVKAATGAKFTKDYEVYHKFETGAANGNCGLTACEMESVCGYDIEADASAYVEKDANGKCRGKTVDLVEHCYAEVADDKAKAAAEKVIKRTRVGEFVGNDWHSVRTAIKACLGKFDTDPNCKINTWDMSKMTSLRFIASGYASFNEYIGDWDVSNVFNFEAAFDGSGFNQDLSKWDMSSAGQLSNMFALCPFNQPIDMWNIRSVWSTYKMFHGNTAFNQDISKLCDDFRAYGYDQQLFCERGIAFV
jgi:sulfur relay (sulfurtransferase) DsrC/TusE family protein